MHAWIETLLAGVFLLEKANLDETAAAEIRNAIIREIDRMKHENKRKPQRTNLSAAQWKAVKNLKEDKSIIIIPADKGNKTVILDRDTYLDKMCDRVLEQTPIDFDAALQLEKSLNAALDDIANSTSDKQKSKKKEEPLTLDRTSLKRFKNDNAITPELGGRLKAHKTDYP